VDYHRLIIYDKLLPAGRLREPVSGKSRADIVIVTKCPKELKPMDYRVITKAMDLFPYQQLYFTMLTYEPLRPVFPREAALPSPTGTSSSKTTVPLQFSQLPQDIHILLLTGIASPRQMQADMKENTGNDPVTLSFPDHHFFRKKDIARINTTFAAIPSPRIIITTEKDAVRLTTAEGLADEVRRSLYVLPIRVKFMLDQEESFNENIIGYVRKNSRNSILVKRKDDNKSKDGHRSGDRPRTISFRNN
jgi:tetraacyldisaccharide 4'-kinase